MKALDQIQFNPCDKYTGKRSNHPLYKTYRDMIRRCGDPDHKDFKYWGGKGIRLCSEWLESFQCFYDWAIQKYSPGLSIERADTAGNYCPENCTWIPKSEQSINRGIFSNNTSGYKGVSFMPTRGKFKAYIGVNKKVIYLGLHISACAAARAYNDYVIAHGLAHPLNELQAHS